MLEMGQVLLESVSQALNYVALQRVCDMTQRASDIDHIRRQSCNSLEPSRLYWVISTLWPPKLHIEHHLHHSGPLLFEWQHFPHVLVKKLSKARSRR